MQSKKTSVLCVFVRNGVNGFITMEISIYISVQKRSSVNGALEYDMSPVKIEMVE